MSKKNIDVIRDYWKPSGRISPRNQRALRRAIAELIVEDISIADFLYYPPNKRRHKKLISALKLEG